MTYPDHCKHFTGMINDVCAAGVNWREVTGGPDFGILTRTPCTNPEHAGKCKLHQLRTQAEIDEENRFWDEQIALMETEEPFWQKIRYANMSGGHGVCECPRCKGKCHWSVAASNRHLHARCETDGCISFME